MGEVEGACHCRRVRFRVKLRDGLRTARRCTCSYCRMRGSVVVSALLADIDIYEGKEHLQLYQFGSMTAKHFFCSQCGIPTHHQRRSNPQEYGVNVACLEGVSPFDFPLLPVFDGQSHPTDHGGHVQQAGTLQFIPTAPPDGASSQ